MDEHICPKVEADCGSPMCSVALAFKLWHYAKICMTPPVGKSFSRGKKYNIQCPDIPAAIPPVSEGGTLPVSEAPQDFTLDPRYFQYSGASSSIF